MSLKQKKTKSPPKVKAPKLIDLAQLPEHMSAASSERDLCKKCGLYEKAASPFQTPWIPDDWTGKLLLVGPPPVESHEHVRPFLPKVGKLIRSIAGRCGYSDNDIAFASVTRCSAANPSMGQLRCCRPFLLEAIRKLNPANVLGLGKYALKSLSNTNNQNITKARGKLIEVPSEKDKANL